MAGGTGGGHIAAPPSPPSKGNDRMDYATLGPQILGRRDGTIRSLTSSGYDMTAIRSAPGTIAVSISSMGDRLFLGCGVALLRRCNE